MVLSLILHVLHLAVEGRGSVEDSVRVVDNREPGSAGTH